MVENGFEEMNMEEESIIEDVSAIVIVRIIHRLNKVSRIVSSTNHLCTSRSATALWTNMNEGPIVLGRQRPCGKRTPRGNVHADCYDILLLPMTVSR